MHEVLPEGPYVIAGPWVLRIALPDRPGKYSFTLHVKLDLKRLD
jgi:hypothetical protein